MFIVGINTEIIPHNQCCQVTIVEGTGSRSGHMNNIYSATNQQTLLIISIKSTQAEEEESGRGEGRWWFFGEVGWNKREERLNRKRRGCAVIWAPSLVIRGEGELVIEKVLDTKSYRQQGRIQRGYGGGGGWKIGRWKIGKWRFSASILWDVIYLFPTMYMG